MYVITRNDLSSAQRAVQAGHVLIETTQAFGPFDEHPSVIICVTKSEHKLNSVNDELLTKGIKTRTFREPDRNHELTAIATRPLRGQEREALSRFQLLT